VSRDIKINYSFSLPPDSAFTDASSSQIEDPKRGQTLPSFSTLPTNLYVENDNLVVAGWTNALMRFFIPCVASSQDAKVSQYFIRYFAQGNALREPEEVKSMLSLAEQHIARGKGWFSSQSQDTRRLEHYTLIARKKMGCSQESLEKKCRADNKGLFAKWTKLGFAEEAFWGSPDLVDFVFNSYLHRHITHPYYRHTIQMRPVLLRQGGQLVMEMQPHLLMDGRETSWFEIRKKIKIDDEERLYSMENGQKNYWMYLDKGLTQWDKNNFENPHRLRQLDRPPLHSRVEIVTTHAHKEDWNIADRLLKGSRHSFFRIVAGEGFSSRHPTAGLEDGSVYSLGWGARWRDFSIFTPLSTLQGRWFCPDNFEFLKEDQCITPVAATEEQIVNLLEIVKKRSKEDHPFHIITSNCCGVTADVLNEAGIMSFCTKDHMANMWYKFLLPKMMRQPLDKIGSFFKRVTPEVIKDVVYRICAFVYSAIFMPFFTLFGAWRTTLAFEDENGNPHDAGKIRARASNRVKALFSDVFDVFSPGKMEFDLTRNIYKQQKRMPQTYFEKHD
jgi:hypothetical protein